MELVEYLILNKKKAPKMGPFLNINFLQIRMQNLTPFDNLLCH